MKKLFVLLFVILFISLVSSFEFDNVKSYDIVTREVTVKNSILGIPTTDIGKARLNTPLNNKVGIGYQKVAEFNIVSYEDYTNAIKEFELIDLNNGKVLEKQIELKYRDTENYLVNDYKRLCSFATKGGNYTCSDVIIGSHYETREIWVDYNKNILDGQTITVGIFTDVKVGERVEWIPTIYGVKVEEWASWTADLNTSLQSYYKLDNNILSDAFGIYNMTSVGTANASGKINSAREFDGTNNDTLTRVSTGLTGAGARSFNVWIYNDDSTNYKDILTYGTEAAGQLFHWRKNNNNKMWVQNQGTSLEANTTITTATWIMVTVVWNGTNTSLYQDGVLVGRSSLGFNTGTVNSMNWGSYLTTAERWDGKIDEIGVWTRALTSDEVLILYNGGAGLPLGFVETNEPPKITLISPNSTNYTTSPQTITFNFTVTDDLNISDVKLYVNDVLNQTNASGLNNTNYLFNVTFDDGTYTVYGKVTDNASQEVNSETITIIVDSSSPTISVTSPVQETIRLFNATLNLNYTITDPYLDDCWYFYPSENTTKNTLNCLTNTTFKYFSGVYNLTIYANDTFGNENSLLVSFPYYAEQTNEYYITPTTSGATTLFYTTFETNGSDVNIAYLNYNGTNNIGTISQSGDIFNVTYNKLIPAVNTLTNISFFWNLTFDGGVSGVTTTKKQLVNPLEISSICGGNNTIINITVLDEETQVDLNDSLENTTVKIGMDVYSLDRSTIIYSYNFLFEGTEEQAVCVTNNLTDGEQYSVDMIIEYSADNYATEFYNIYNRILNSSTFNYNLSLYDLLNTTSQSFRLIVRDSAYLPIANALIQIERKYIENGTFEIVEVPKTDYAGITLASLVLNDVIYNFKIYFEGELISQFNNVRAICQTPLISTCEIDFNSFQEGIVMPNFETDDDFNFDILYNKTLRVVSSPFAIPSGTPATVQLVVTTTDTIGQSVCTDSVTSSFGTLECTVAESFGNSTIKAVLYKDSVEVANGYVSDYDSSSDIYGVMLTLMSIMVMMTLIGLAITDSPIVTLLLVIVGVVLLSGMFLIDTTGLIGSGATFLFLVILLILFVIKAGRRT